jgi:polar amino acid transport system substrate-binding protein
MMTSKLPATGLCKVVSACLLGALSLSCQNEGSPPGAGAPANTAAIRSSRYPLPDRVLESGTLEVGVVPQFQPVAFFPSGTGELAGADIDILEALAAKFGLQVRWRPVQFDAMLAGVASRRFDLAITGISDTRERQQMMTFVDYLKDSKIFLTLKGNPYGISGELTSVCGLTIAVQRGTLDPRYFGVLKSVCSDAGLPEISSLDFSASSDKKLAVQSGRVDVSFFSTVDFPALQEESGGAFSSFRTASSSLPFRRPCRN